MQASELRPDQLDRAVAVMREGVATGDAAESVMAIAGSTGLVRLETAAPPEPLAEVRPDSIFLLASITKTFFGTAIMQLVEQGRLMLSDTVARYIPGFAAYGKEHVTIWHLLTHTSGLADEADGLVWQEQLPPDAHLEAACRAFLHFPPGTQYEYCNLSFWALAEIVARVSGEPYADYLRRHILDPLGMSDTSFSPEGEQAERFIKVRQAEDPNATPGDYFLTLALPAGGLCSTAPDLVRYGQAMLRGLCGGGSGILSQAGIATMTRLHTRSVNERDSNRPAEYGLGWGKPGSITLGTRAPLATAAPRQRCSGSSPTTISSSST